MPAPKKSVAGYIAKQAAKKIVKKPVVKLQPKPDLKASPKSNVKVVPNKELLRAARKATNIKKQAMLRANTYGNKFAPKPRD